MGSNINYEHVGVVPMSVRLSVAEITCREAGAAQNAVFPTFHSVVATHFFSLKTGPFVQNKDFPGATVHPIGCTRWSPSS